MALTYGYTPKVRAIWGQLPFYSANSSEFTPDFAPPFSAGQSPNFWHRAIKFEVVQDDCRAAQAVKGDQWPRTPCAIRRTQVGGPCERCSTGPPRPGVRARSPGSVGTHSAATFHQIVGLLLIGSWQLELPSVGIAFILRPRGTPPLMEGSCPGCCTFRPRRPYSHRRSEWSRP
jgi:hypothetical protein